MQVEALVNRDLLVAHVLEAKLDGHRLAQFENLFAAANQQLKTWIKTATQDQAVVDAKLLATHDDEPFGRVSQEEVVVIVEAELEALIEPLGAQPGATGYS